MAETPEFDPSMVRPLIDVSHTKGRFEWVAYLAEYDLIPRTSGKRETIEEMRATWRQWRAFLVTRFGYEDDPQPSNNLAAGARNTLALLLAEGSADSQKEAIAQAAAAAAQVAPDLGAALPNWKEIAHRAPTRVNARQVQCVRQARITLKKLAQLGGKASTTTAQESTVSRYVFVQVQSYDFDFDSGRATYIRRYRILRESDQFVFVSPSYSLRRYGMDWDCKHLGTDQLGRGTVRVPKACIGNGCEALSWAVKQRLKLAWSSPSNLQWSEDDLDPLQPTSTSQVASGSDNDAQLLELKPGEWTAAALKRAYRAKAKALHPDTGGDAAQFQALTDAYERLQKQLHLQKVN